MTTSMIPPHLQTGSAAEARSAIRSGRWPRQTAGLAAGYVQANLAILPGEAAEEFRLFCELNPKPCPLLDMTAAGSPAPATAAPDADLRTDLPRYRVWEYGELVDEPEDITAYWRDDLVGFLLGCSFTFEFGLIEAGIPMRNLEQGQIVSMYRTSIECEPSGRFHGPVVVSMRAIPVHQVDLATEISSRYPAVHGGPVHVGNPADIGILDLGKPEWGDPPVMEPGDVPMFWACGATPQAVAMQAKPDLMITHSPGNMFITDLRIDDLEVAND